MVEHDYELEEAQQEEQPPEVCVEVLREGFGWYKATWCRYARFTGCCGVIRLPDGILDECVYLQIQ